MRTFRFRGKDRLVGACRPTPSTYSKLAQLPRFRARFLHPSSRMRGRLGQIPLPASPTHTNFRALNREAADTMLANGPDPTAPPDIAQTGVGDCTIALILHLAAQWEALAGVQWVPTSAQALALYSAVAGYREGDPSTDNGADPMQVLEYFLIGQGGNPLPDLNKTTLASISTLDANDVAEWKLALALAGGTYGWLCLPDGCESEETSTSLWQPCGDPNPQSGHATSPLNYGIIPDDVCEQNNIAKGTPGGLYETWGEQIWATESFVQTYHVPAAGGGLVALVPSNLDISSGVSRAFGTTYSEDQLKNFLAALAS